MKIFSLLQNNCGASGTSAPSGVLLLNRANVICFPCAIHPHGRLTADSPHFSYMRGSAFIFQLCYAEFDWVLDPGRSSGLESRKSMPLQVQEPLTDLTKDHSLLLKCHDMALDCFWITVNGERTSSCCKQCH